MWRKGEDSGAVSCRKGGRRPVPSCEEKEPPHLTNQQPPATASAIEPAFWGESRAGQACWQRPVIVALGRLRQKAGCGHCGQRSISLLNLLVSRVGGAGDPAGLEWRPSLQTGVGVGTLLSGPQPSSVKCFLENLRGVKILNRVSGGGRESCTERKGWGGWLPPSGPSGNRLLHIWSWRRWEGRALAQRPRPR